jgi:hypothetical protein
MLQVQFGGFVWGLCLGAVFGGLGVAPVHTWCTHGVSIKYNIYSCWGISDHTALPMRAAVHMQRKLRTQMHRRCGPARCGEHFTSRGVVDAGHRPDAGQKWVVRGYRARIDPQAAASSRSRLPCPHRRLRRPNMGRSRLPCPYRPPQAVAYASRSRLPCPYRPRSLM